MKHKQKSTALLAALSLFAVAPGIGQADPLPPGRWGVGSPVQPGGVIGGRNYAINGCAADRVVSSGFTFPMKMINDGQFRDWGTTRAILKPGTYTATIYCYNGTSASTTFTITDAPVSAEPPLTKQPLPR